MATTRRAEMHQNGFSQKSILFVDRNLFVGTLPTAQLKRTGTITTTTRDSQESGLWLQIAEKSKGGTDKRTYQNGKITAIGSLTSGFDWRPTCKQEQLRKDSQGLCTEW